MPWRRVIDAVLYLLCSGVQWRLLHRVSTGRNAQDYERLAETGEMLCYICERAEQAAARHGISLNGVKLPEATRDRRATLLILTGL